MTREQISDAADEIIKRTAPTAHCENTETLDQLARAVYPDDDAIMTQLLECRAICDGKVHHDDKASAREHVASLKVDGSPDAFFYACDCPSEGEHFHVASSPIPRRWRA